MISGAMRGRGGRALSSHLLKAENDAVTVIEARGLGSPDLHGQLSELVALSLGGRTDQPVYHFHIDPESAIPDTKAARERWWSLFEQEFRLTGQPYCGAVHVKHGRMHEHRVYGLVRPNGGVVDLSFDFARREKVSRVVEFEFGVAPVASKHARLIASQLRVDGRDEVAGWLEASGMLDLERPVAPLSPEERLIQERTGIPLADVRSLALSAWHASSDGQGFRTELARRGLDLRQGRAGVVLIDPTGTAHMVTRIIGAASKATDKERITAAVVKARLAETEIANDGENNDGGVDSKAGHGGPETLGDHGGHGTRGDLGDAGRIQRADRGFGGSGVSDHRPGRGDPAIALARFAAFSGRRVREMARYLGMVGIGQLRARIEEIERARQNDQGRLVPTVDVWGVGQLK